MEITDDLKSVVFGAGTTYSHLIKLLASNKVALQNMPSAPHINIVGSLITGTHGGGVELPIMSHYAEGFRYMSPRGEMEVAIKGKDADFYKKLHSFGLAGAITSMQLAIVPEFAVKKCIYANLPWDFVNDPESFTDVLTAGNYLSFFTDWKQEAMTSVWIGKRLDTWTDELL
jgi:xylitol oxidase